MSIPEFSVAGQTVVVTGGANGLGRGYCSVFRRAGCNVVIADIDPAGADYAGELQAVPAGDPNLDVGVMFVETDVTRRESVAAMLDRAVARFGRRNRALAHELARRMQYI